VLNNPAGQGERFVPAASRVLVDFNAVGRIGSADHPDAMLGGMAYREVLVWFPMLDRRRRKMVWAVPYAFVDQGAPLSGGREIFGFPKQLADIAVSGDRESLAELTVSALAIERFAASASAQQRRVIDVRPEVSDGRSPLWSDAAGVRTWWLDTISGA